MKNFSKILLAVAVTSAGFVASCKKGEEDPTISLRSRDGRMIGEWKLVSQEMTTTDNNSFGSSAGATVNNTTTVSSVADGSMTVTTTEVETDPTNTTTPTVTTTTTEKSDYTMSLNITEDGRAVITTTNSPKTRTLATSPANTCPTGFGTPGQTCDGTYTYTNTSNTTTMEGYWNWADSKKKKVMVHIDNLGDFYVNMLKNDEMVLMMDSSDDMTQTATYNNQFSNSTKGTWTFSQE